MSCGGSGGGGAGGPCRAEDREEGEEEEGERPRCALRAARRCAPEVGGLAMSLLATRHYPTGEAASLIARGAGVGNGAAGPMDVLMARVRELNMKTLAPASPDALNPCPMRQVSGLGSAARGLRGTWAGEGAEKHAAACLVAHLRRGVKHEALHGGKEHNASAIVVVMVRKEVGRRWGRCAPRACQRVAT